MSRPQALTLHLQPGEVAILAAALRQYEPYWSPDDADAVQRLGELARQIHELLGRLGDPDPTRTPGVLRALARHGPALRSVPPAAADQPDEGS
jgi:uncharacterized membrane protein YccC